MTDSVVKIDRSAEVGSIKLIMGCMYSGKTSKLVSEWEKWTSIGVNVVVINYSGDDRYGSDDYMYTHTERKVPCTKTYLLGDIDESIIENNDVILVNEGQFFPDLKDNVIKWCEQNKKHVVVAGLDSDFERKKFGQMLDLVLVADDVVKVKALCAVCRDGTRGIFTWRKTGGKEQLVIGASNYMAVCRRHYSELSDKQCMTCT